MVNSLVLKFSLISLSSSLFNPQIMMSVTSLRSSLADTEHPRAILIFNKCTPFGTLLCSKLCVML